MQITNEYSKIGIRNDRLYLAYVSNLIEYDMAIGNDNIGEVTKLLYEQNIAMTLSRQIKPLESVMVMIGM